MSENDEAKMTIEKRLEELLKAARVFEEEGYVDDAYAIALERAARAYVREEKKLAPRGVYGVRWRIA